MNKKCDYKLYNDEFYDKSGADMGYKSAQIVLAKVLEALPPLHSAVDFGCGPGVWLAAIKEAGVKEIQGYDGNWLDKKVLWIPPECFTAAELADGVVVDRKYDLAISVEVAEHLPEKSADLFIKSLTSASDFVLFSAAIPFQGGTNHINEQWPDYWNALFNKYGYTVMDFLRPLLWNEKDVASYYRQSIMLFVKTEMMHKVKLPTESNNVPLSLVHPESYLYNIRIINNPLKKFIPSSIKSKIKQILYKQVNITN